MTTIKEINQKLGTVAAVLEELKSTLNFVTSELSEIKQKQDVQHADIVNVSKRVKVVEEICSDNQGQIEEMQVRLDQLEQYTRKDNVIIQGLKSGSYAAAASDATEDEDLSDEQLEANVLKFFETDLGVVLAPADINIMHYVPAKVGKNILVKFVTRKSKLLVLKNRSKLKGKQVYISEHLTRRNNQLFYQARMLAKQNRVSGAWVRNAKVFVRTNGDPTVAKTYVITCSNDFQRFKIV